VMDFTFRHTKRYLGVKDPWAMSERISHCFCWSRWQEYISRSGHPLGSMSSALPADDAPWPALCR
jgi:hypothetical protein